MENQTGFNLNDALERWRNELAAQPNLTSDDRRELEAHLRDAIAEFRRRGLNDDESFWLARRRIGQPQQLADEFVRANPANVWRERVFWMWMALFLSGTLGSLFRSLAFIALTPLNIRSDFAKAWLALEIGLVILSVLIPVVIAVLLARGKLVSTFSRLLLLLENRQRFALAMLACIALSFTFHAVSLMVYNWTAKGPVQLPLWNYVMPTIYSLIIALLLIWLMPQNRKILKHG